MRRYRATWLVFGVFVAMVGIAWAQVEFPQVLKDVAPLYPGAKVEMALNTDDGSHASLTTKDSPKQVVEFYKKTVTDKGWKVEMEMAQGSGQMIFFSKGKQSLQVIADGSSPGKTTVALNLGKK
jgi:hypothetical protein